MPFKLHPKLGSLKIEVQLRESRDHAFQKSGKHISCCGWDSGARHRVKCKKYSVCGSAPARGAFVSPSTSGSIAVGVVPLVSDK